MMKKSVLNIIHLFTMLTQIQQVSKGVHHNSQSDYFFIIRDSEFLFYIFILVQILFSFFLFYIYYRYRLLILIIN
jgi:hypothetical protein